MAKAVGIDIGSGNIKICEVEGTARKFKVTKYVEAEFERSVDPAHEAEEIADTIRELCSAAKIKRDNVIAAMSSQDCVMRDITVPFTGDDQVKKVIRFEAESHLHSHSLEEVVVDYYKTGEKGNRSSVLIFAGLKTHLSRTIEIFEDAVIDPLQIDLDALATYSAVLAAGCLDDDSTQVILDFGAEKTNLIITNGEDVQLVRSIRIGTESAHEGMPEALPAAGDVAAVAGDADAEAPQGDWVVVEDAVLSEEIDAEPAPAEAVPAEAVPAESVSAERGSAERGSAERGSAERGSAERGDSARDGSGVSPVVVESRSHVVHQDFPFLHRVVVEIQRSLVRSHRPMGKVLITGGGSLIEGLPAALEDRLQVPVEWVDLRENVVHDLDEEDIDKLSSFGTVSLGLALKGVGLDPIGVDFRQDEFRYQRAFDQIKIVAACCVSLVAILLLVILAFFLERKSEAIQPWRVMVSESRVAAEEALEELDNVTLEEKAVLKMVQAVQKKRRAYETQFGKGGGFPELKSSLELWNDLFRAFLLAGQDVVGVKIENVNIDQDSIELEGELADPSQGDVLRAAIKKSSELFQNVSLPTITADKGVTTFKNLKISLSEN